MTILGHDRVMKVKISELKARLSAYLDLVRRGKTVIVLDRKTPIAQLVPFSGSAAGLQVEPAARPLGDLEKIGGVRLKRKIDVVKLLGESRGER